VVEYSPGPNLDLDGEFAEQGEIKKLIRKRLVNSANDVSEGGLFTTLLESCLPRGLGFDVQANPTSVDIRDDAWWFGESQGRVVVTVAKENRNDFIMLLEKLEMTVTYLGNVNSGKISINGENWGPVSGWKEKYDNAIGNLLSGHESEHALAAL